MPQNNTGGSALAFFQTTTQRYPQYRIVRRNGGKPSGVVVIHTVECPYNRRPSVVAEWMTRRADPGSYHALAGARSTRDVLQLAPWSFETWHETSTNNHAVGISMTAYAGDWRKVPRTPKENLVKSAAFAAYQYATWLKANRGITIPARRITRTQALNRVPGFIGHGDIDTGRRSDPGAHFDWSMFLIEYKRLMGGSPGKRVRLDVDGVLGPATVTQWQLQRKTAADGVVSRPDSSLVRAVQVAINRKSGKGGFQLLKGPLRVDGSLGTRTWKAIQALLNVWGARTISARRIPLKRPLDITGRPDKRTVMALQKSINAQLWK